MKKEFAFFDVDKTILKRDSMQDLLYFAWKKHPLSIIPSIFCLLFSLIKFLVKGRNDIRILKEGVFFVLRFLSEDELKYFVEEILLREKAIRRGIKEVKSKVEQGYIVALVSASPENYLKYFEEPLGVHKTIGTLMSRKGKIDGENCKHSEKVRRIRAWLIANDWEIDYDNSFAYSDSYAADQPMLELVKNRYLINSKLSLDGYKNLYWE